MEGRSLPGSPYNMKNLSIKNLEVGHLYKAFHGHTGHFWLRKNNEKSNSYNVYKEGTSFLLLEINSIKEPYILKILCKNTYNKNDIGEIWIHPYWHDRIESIEE